MTVPKTGTQSTLILFFCTKFTNIQKNTFFGGGRWSSQFSSVDPSGKNIKMSIAVHHWWNVTARGKLKCSE